MQACLNAVINILVLFVRTYEPPAVCCSVCCLWKIQRAATNGTLPEGRVTRQSVTEAAAAVEEPEPLRQGRSKYGTRLATGAPVGAFTLLTVRSINQDN